MAHDERGCTFRWYKERGKERGAAHEPAVNVRIPGLLRSYTAGAEMVELPAHASLDAAVRDLDARFPGLRFRIIDEQGAIRPHIKVFVDGELVRRLDASVRGAAELMIVGALSGG